ncbi:TonB-dependent receptor [Phaeodactylibacter luteus]|uniref:TonB-dependent receptor n=1 Tax=Phaeodactylibacter luteus TaxID=1564516 RepID=A0A5C6RXZ5_9BACT|nr:TonB-dependent receptor [Phaeodactylibacter luteus]TXB66232.1 TonB-dependent receptor [Phaeodactylibacter luteus]
MRQLLETEQKALEINLDPSIYGTFAEIGAGQEVARYFFQVGAAAGTIAKTMSAYDKTYSDQIYGEEVSGRYVCEARLYKMLDHEHNLMRSRLRNERPDTNFFVFADTVAAINYQRTIKGNGWLGIRFQLHPDGGTNNLVLHVRMLDNDNQLQQQAIGILGVNLIYACFRYNQDPEVMLQSLMDSLHGRVKVDMVRLTGPDFADLDNRLLSLWMVKNKLTDVAMFGPDRQNVHASEFLYKKHVMLVRGSFRPATLVNLDMIQASYQQFRNEADTDPRKTYLMTEITLDNLCSQGELDEQDFLDRAELLNALGQAVAVSDCQKHQKMVAYLSDYKVQRLGFVLGVRELLELINQKYYQNLDGRLLAAFGQLFTRNVKFYVYPALQEGSGELLNAHNLPIPEGVKFLYKHLLDNRQIVDVTGFNPNVLHIFSKEVLHMLQTGQQEWESMVPAQVASLIKEKYLFRYPVEQIQFDY